MTPKYFQTNPTYGTRQFGKINYMKSNGLQSRTNLRPMYAGEAWDRLTFWDTKAEKKAKAKQAKAEEEAFQEQLAEIASKESTAEGPSMLTYAVVGAAILGTLFILK